MILNTPSPIQHYDSKPQNRDVKIISLRTIAKNNCADVGNNPTISIDAETDSNARKQCHSHTQIPPHTRKQLLSAIQNITEMNNTNNQNKIDKLEKIVQQQIRRKIAMYRIQDEKMGRVTEDNATPEEIVRLLHESKLTCNYCLCLTKMFAAPRSPDSWTLDRKENHISHTIQNVVVCCLKCNLNKRRRDTEKYRFAKQLLNIERLGHDDLK